MAEVKGRMDKVFVNLGDGSLNANGIYALNFYALGSPHTTIVDDYLPLHQYGPEHYQTLFSNVGEDNSLWTAVLEKAFAKYHGNYNHIEGGDSRDALRTLYGSPHGTQVHSETDVDTLWK